MNGVSSFFRIFADESAKPGCASAGHTGTGVLCGYADLMMEKLIPVRRTSCRILAPYSFASLMISSLRSRLYVSLCAWHRVIFN